ncbi:NUDIX hydrolase [Rhodococcus erythropolis]|nr:NUDIX hydrolase [Rhodococcus erythropolis]
MRLRHSARGLVVDDQSRLLLYRFIAPGGGLTVWCPPGGGLEGDETPPEALARELDEEIGLRDYGDATHVWHEEIRDPTILPGWDGAINDYFLVPVAAAQWSRSVRATRFTRQVCTPGQGWITEFAGTVCSGTMRAARHRRIRAFRHRNTAKLGLWSTTCARSPSRTRLRLRRSVLATGSEGCSKGCRQFFAG